MPTVDPIPCPLSSTVAAGYMVCAILESQVIRLREPDQTVTCTQFDLIGSLQQQIVIIVIIIIKDYIDRHSVKVIPLAIAYNLT